MCVCLRVRKRLGRKGRKEEGAKEGSESPDKGPKVVTDKGQQAGDAAVGHLKCRCIIIILQVTFKFGKEAVDDLLLRGMIDSSQSCQREREREREREAVGALAWMSTQETTGLAVNAGGALWHLWPEMVEAELKTVSRFCVTSQIPPGVLCC